MRTINSRVERRLDSAQMNIRIIFNSICLISTLMASWRSGDFTMSEQCSIIGRCQESQETAGWGELTRGQHSVKQRVRTLGGFKKNVEFSTLTSSAQKRSFGSSQEKYVLQCTILQYDSNNGPEAKNKIIFLHT